MTRTRVPILIGVVLVVAMSLGLAVWISAHLSVLGTGDYSAFSRPGADNAGPPVETLVHGHFSRLPAVQTVMGLTSVLYRVPFVAVAAALGAGPRLGFVVGAVACLLVVIGLVAWVIAQELSWRQLGLAAIAALAMIIGPSTDVGLLFGHPEEILTAALATFAVIAAQADRRTMAAVLLGLAVGSKEWALLMAPAVLLALPAGRTRAALVAIAIAAVLSGLLPVIDFSAFQHADRVIGTIRAVALMSFWWPIAAPFHHLPLGLNRAEAAPIGLAVCLGVVWLIGRRLHAGGRAFPDPGRIDPLALLALLGLLRCICDPSSLDYYLVSAVVPLAVWETGRLRRFPAATVVLWGVQVIASTGLMPLAETTSILTGPAAVYLFLAVTLGLAAHLTAHTFRPAGVDRDPVAATEPEHGSLGAPALSI